MSGPTDMLIERLAGEASPVRRLHPPMRRAAWWLLGAAALIALAVLAADPARFGARAQQASVRLELVGTLATGVLAVMAAFHLSLPDRSPWWAALPLPAAALWIMGSGMGCYRAWISHQAGMWQVGESGHCLATILGCGLPLAAALLWPLGRARPLAPVPVATTAGLGAAAFAAFLLLFYHDVPATFMDLALHAIGVAAVVATCRFGASTRSS